MPTTNFQLRWIAGTTGGLNYDEDLREIPVITVDAFEILLPLSIVAHISPMNAPHVIQRFSNVQRLVTQTLDPFVSAYFKDAAQSRTLLEFVQGRQNVQAAALATMRERLREHRIDVEEVLLGTPRAPLGDDRMETVLEQLRQRQIAAEQEKTFEIQKTTASKRRELAEEQARADQQPDVTKSELSIRIADNAGRAEAARQTRLADGIRVTAEAEGVQRQGAGGSDRRDRGAAAAVGVGNAGQGRARGEDAAGAVHPGRGRPGRGQQPAQHAARHGEGGAGRWGPACPAAARAVGDAASCRRPGRTGIGSGAVRGRLAPLQRQV